MDLQMLCIGMTFLVVTLISELSTFLLPCQICMYDCWSKLLCFVVLTTLWYVSTLYVSITDLSLCAHVLCPVVLCCAVLCYAMLSREKLYN